MLPQHQQTWRLIMGNHWNLKQLERYPNLTWYCDKVHYKVLAQPIPRPFLSLHYIQKGIWVALQRGIRLLLIILLQEIGEFRKLLKYLNEDLSPIICILLIVNISFSASGIAWLLKFDAVDTETEPIKGVSVLNTLLWMLIVVAPFIQVSHFATVLSIQKWI